jgi:hypothetical protein
MQSSTSLAEWLAPCNFCPPVGLGHAVVYLTASVQVTPQATARTPQLHPLSSAEFSLWPCGASAMASAWLWLLPGQWWSQLFPAVGKKR